MMKKRILATLMAVVMVFSMIPATSFAAGTGTPTIAKSNMTLSGILHVNFKVNANGANMSGYEMHVYTGQDTEPQVITNYTVDADGLYVFRADLIAHRMMETLTAKLMKNGEVVATDTWDIVSYVAGVKALEEYKNDTKLHEMLDAMIYYGQYVQYYAHHAEGIAYPNVQKVEDVTANMLEDFQFLFAKSPDWKVGANLYLDDSVDIQFTFKTDKPITVTVNGKPQTLTTDEKTGWQICTMEEILPQNWNKIYTVVATTTDENGTTTTELALEYGVYSYIYSKLLKAETTTGLHGVVKSMYLFGQAVSAYASNTGLHHIVTTPNLDRVLYTGGESNYRLVFDYKGDPDKNPETNRAQSEAASYINRIFNKIGCKNIEYADVDAISYWDETSKYIIMGDKDLFEKAGLTMPQSALGATGYYIVTKGNSVFIMVDEYADEAQAYQLAAMAFMLEVAGYLQYSDDCIGYDADPALITIPDMEIIEKPDMDFRLPSAYMAIENPYDMGYTTNNMFIPVDGETYHTALKLLDPDTYYGYVEDKSTALNTNMIQHVYNTHEWFHCVDEDQSNDGIYNVYQLCYSKIMANNPIDGKYPYDIIFKNMKDAILKADSSLYNISFGIADNDYICPCNDCTEYDGGAVGAYLDVANRLAVDIAKDPEIFAHNQNSIRVMVLAYRQYFELPVVKDGDVHLDANVAVMLAPISASCNTPLREQTNVGVEGKRNYPAILEAWAEEANHMYLWLYQANFSNYMYPMNSWEVMQDNLQYARSLGVELLFYQGMGDTTNGTGFTKLKEYLETEWAYEADQLATDLVPDFFQHYFGSGWEQMAKFYQELSAHMSELKEKGQDTGNYKEAINTTANWPQAKLQEFMGYVNAAYEAVRASGDANANVYIERIRLESMFPRFALLELYGDTATAGSYAEFRADCERLKLNMHHEHTDWATWVSSLGYVERNKWATCTHDYTSQSTVAKYLYSNATLEAAAQYLYSCSKCGAAGEDTFTYGDAIQSVNKDLAAIELLELQGDNCTFTLPDENATITGVTLNGNPVTSYELSGTSLNVSTAALNACCGQSATLQVTYKTATSVVVATCKIELVVTRIIKTFADLSVLNSVTTPNLTGYYVLGNNIDAQGQSINSGSTPNWDNTGFQGVFDGRNHTVSNLNLNGDGSYSGIFGNVSGGTIKNITFDNVVYTKRASLFGRFMANKAGTEQKTTIQNVTVNVTGWAANPEEAGIFSTKRLHNTVFDNVVVNVEKGITITTLLGTGLNTGNTEGNLTVNLGVGSSITYYNDSSTTKPAFVTVNQAVAQDINTETIIEGNTMPAGSHLTDGAVTVTIGGTAYSGTVANGQLTVTGLPTATGKLESAVVEQGDATYTYTNIWHVTQVIDNVAELKALGAACKAANTTGYYILGGNIDCSAEANMANGSGNNPGKGFAGTFDGRGFTISNITMTWDQTTGGTGGLFGGLWGATIQNTTFDNVNLGTNGMLLASDAQAYDGNNVNLTNLTVNLTKYATTYGVIVGYDMLNTVAKNLVINVADGQTVTCLLSRDSCSIAYVNATVNLGAGSTITNYYSNVTAKPDTITVNQARVPTTATVDTLVAGEQNTSVTFAHDVFADCTTATVVINDQSKSVNITDGKIALNLADYGVSALGQYKAVITTNQNDVLTFTDVFYVTQVIDTVEELKALGTSCKDSIVTGYYILGDNIDCNTYATMSNGSTSNTTNGFQGTFDGRGMTISNIKMTWDSATGGLGGLFGKLLGCTIQNTTFDNVNLGTNGTLLASGAAAYNGSNVNLKNLTVNLTGCTTAYGVVVGYSMFNTVGSGLVFNIADNVTVAALMARDDCNSIGYISATVNLGAGSSITTYYKNTSTPPTTFTVATKS